MIAAPGGRPACSRRSRAGVTGRAPAAAGLRGLPLADAAEPLLRGRAPWYRDWLAHPDLRRPVLGRRSGHGARWTAVDRAGAAGRRLAGPVPGPDAGAVPGAARPRRRRRADRRPVDPPGRRHPGGGDRRRETLAWLDEHLAGATGRTRRARCGSPAPATGAGATCRRGRRRPHRGGGGWPLRAARGSTPRRRPDPSAGRAAAPTPGDRRPRRDADGIGRSSATTRPTPPRRSAGACSPRTRASGTTGALAARADVVTFTTPPLPHDLVIAGTPTVELDHVADPPHADVFVRLCDVAPNGRSHNFTDGMRRRDPADGPVTIELDPCFHRVAAGHRLALLISGGAHPRFLRNNGTGEPPADAIGLVAVIHRIRGGLLTLPVTDDHQTFPPSGVTNHPSRAS